MHNDDHDIPVQYDDEELRLFAQLPREAPLAPGEGDRLIRRLRDDGFFHSRSGRWRWALVAAAALVLFVSGVAAGGFMTRRNSLEDMLSRSDLGVGDHVLLLQRAGTAYVRAAQGYADATAHIDSGAVEVASKVLLGAAHAVARNSLDAGLSARLAAAFQPLVVTPVSAPRKPVIWF
jgi:hypothetical protein